MSGFVRIRENRSNLWKFRSWIESTIQIFENRTCESGFVNLWFWICQSQNRTNLFGVRICDHNMKQIHVLTNLFYDSRILSFLEWKNPSMVFVLAGFEELGTFRTLFVFITLEVLLWYDQQYHITFITRIFFSIFWGGLKFRLLVIKSFLK